MKKEKSNQKVFSVILPKETWICLKKHCIDQEVSMNEMINTCLTKIFKKIEKTENKELTNNS